MKQKRLPLLCWDIAYSSLFNDCSIQKDYNALHKLQKQFRWINAPNFSNALRKYKTLVITTPNQRIVWVSHNFFNMTGYSLAEVKNKKPSMFQGKKTNPNDVLVIGKKLKQLKPFKHSLINYRKNQNTYMCELNITPLFNKKQEVTHFLACENEVF